jgi:aminomethyltransferase
LAEEFRLRMHMTEPRKTPLAELHEALGARLIEFAGWWMPLQYSGALEEHLAVRTAVGLFDISHMGRFELRGPEALAAIQMLTPNDASRLRDHQAQYSALTTAQGTFIDDITVYRVTSEHFLLCVNAANREKDFRWISDHIGGRAANLYDVSASWAQIALQGPAAEHVLQSLTDVVLGRIRYYWFDDADVAGVRCLIARMGYTGEDGFEIYVPSESVSWVWNRILDAGREAGIKPCGLAARNTLRLEAAMLLYGHDIDETTTVLEANLSWMVKFEKGEFLGRDALWRQRQEGLRRRLVGFEVRDRAPARDGYPVMINGQPVGRVTSGSFAPFLKKNIGLTYLPMDYTGVGTRFHILVRNRPVEAEVVPTPFYKRPK